jgi:alpha-1,6-mannosyltransferase
MIEGLVNLHFELVMVALLVVALDLILRRQMFVAGIFLGLAIQVKLIPLLLLPFFLPVLKWKNSFLLGFVSLMIFGLTSLVFIHPSNIHHVLASLQLYYGNFEFNSSTYRLLLKYGFWKYHFYRIPYYGLFLSRIATVLLLLFAWFRMDWSDWSTFFKRISWGFLAYYLCATTVHPWYLIVPLLFGLLAGYRFFYLWGFLVFLSYAFYSEAFVPYLWAIHLLEYGILIGSVVQTVRLDFKKVLTE